MFKSKTFARCLFAFTIALISVCDSDGALAQATNSTLEKRVEALERETQRLRGEVVQLKYALQAKNGVVKEIKMDGKTVATMQIAPDGWGCSANDVAAVCQKCAETVVSAIPPQIGREPTILIIRSEHGPRVLTQRGLNDEYILLVSSGERRWAQLAYQFSHEIGHVLCGDLSLKMPQHWFEEAFCEALSLWTLDQMSVSWKTNPPYPNWSSYAPNLGSYSTDVKQRIKSPANILAWYREQQSGLNKDAYNRDKNLVLAKLIVQQAAKDKKFLRSFYYMRRNESGSDNVAKPEDNMKVLTTDWLRNCPEDLKPAPQFIADLLGL